MQRYWEINGQRFGPVKSTCGFPEGDAHSVWVMLSIALLWASNVQAAATAAYADNWSWHTGNEHDHGPAAKATTDVTECCGLDIDWKRHGDGHQTPRRPTKLGSPFDQKCQYMKLKDAIMPKTLVFSCIVLELGNLEAEKSGMTMA
jgi:hypothetical protein